MRSPATRLQTPRMTRPKSPECCVTFGWKFARHKIFSCCSRQWVEAQPCAASLDQEEWGEVVGTIAGDNTVLIICPDARGSRDTQIQNRGVRWLTPPMPRSVPPSWAVSGYAGAELARLLLNHPRLAATPPLFLGRGDTKSLALTSMHPQLSGLPNADSLTVVPFDWKLLEREQIDILFLATPARAGPRSRAHSAREEYSRDRSFRSLALAARRSSRHLQTRRRRRYAGCHAAGRSRVWLSENCMGLKSKPPVSSRTRAAMRLRSSSRSLPCFARTSWISAAALSATPSRASREQAKPPHPTRISCMRLTTFLPTPFSATRHTGEILEQSFIIWAAISFSSPRICCPIPRGILSTIYLRLNTPGSIKNIQDCFDEFYADSPLVRVRRSPALPQIQHVVRTSFCDIGFELSPDGKRLVVISCLDNLLKGAASQAVQNMNLMAGWHEAEGLL